MNKNRLNLFKLLKNKKITQKSLQISKKKVYTLVTQKTVTQQDIKIFFFKLFDIQIKKINVLNLSKNKNYKKFYLKFSNSSDFSNFKQNMLLCL